MAVDPIGTGGAVSIAIYVAYKEILPRLRNGNGRTAGGQPVEAWEGQMRETVRAEVREAVEPVAEVLRDIRTILVDQGKLIVVVAEAARAELAAKRMSWTALPRSPAE